jgi:hypothetical protein
MTGFILALGLQATAPLLPAGDAGLSQELLIGSWVLASREDRTADGTLVAEPNLGSDPLGFLVYDASGNVAVQLMRRGRTSKSTSALPQNQPSSNNSAAAGGYDAYFGTYTIDSKARTVTHQLAGALVPADVGRSLTRQVVVVGGELRLSFQTTGATGGQVTRTLVWQRAESVK